MVFSNQSSRPSSLILLFVVFTFFYSSKFVEAKNSSIKPTKNISVPNKKWAVIDGFRSAKFGMTEKQVTRAIEKDFKLPMSKIKRSVSNLEKTSAMTIKIPELFGAGGAAQISYIFGHQSKNLSHINIFWGLGVSEKVDAQGIVEAANLLRTHFNKKRYKEGLVLNTPLTETSTIVFRGSDKKGRMALILMIAPKPLKDENPVDAAKRVSLKLSYVLNPMQPDVLTVKEGDF